MLTSGIETILPVRTCPAVVRRLVEALYAGTIELPEDVEQMLVLANCMQVSSILLPQAELSNALIALCLCCPALLAHPLSSH